MEFFIKYCVCLVCTTNVATYYKFVVLFYYLNNYLNYLSYLFYYFIHQMHEMFSMNE